MAYDVNKFHKLGALKDLGLRVAQELEKDQPEDRGY